MRNDTDDLISRQPEKHTETHACDLIERQAAIDACIRVREYRAYDEIEEIKALPSAQPKIVRCKECVNSDENYHCDYMTTWNYGDCFCSYGKRRTDG